MKLFDFIKNVHLVLILNLKIEVSFLNKRKIFEILTAQITSKI